MSKGLSELLNLAGDRKFSAPARGEAARPTHGDRELVEVDIDDISPNQFQPRTEFDSEELSALAASIGEVGVLQPVLIRLAPEPQEGETGVATKYELIAGERRWRASKLAGLDKIPAVLGHYEDRDSLEQAIVENLHRQDLNAVEEALAYMRLTDEFGLSNTDIAKRVGKSRPAVANTIRLLNLPEVVLEMLREDRISAGHARTICALDDAELQLELAEKIERQNLSVRAVEDLVRGINSATPLPEDSSPAENFAHLEVQSILEEYLATKCKVDGKGQRGKITIDFADTADLARIFELIVPRGEVR